jgi:hypothetical protein
MIPEEALKPNLKEKKKKSKWSREFCARFDDALEGSNVLDLFYTHKKDKDQCDAPKT